MYKLLKDNVTNKEYGAIKFNDNGTYTSFLFDPDNTDYQEYLEWVADGGVPEPADTPEEAE